MCQDEDDTKAELQQHYHNVSSPKFLVFFGCTREQKILYMILILHKIRKEAVTQT